MQGRTAEWDRRPQLSAGWPRRPYLIEDGTLRPVPGGPVEWYDPFEYGYYHGRGGTERRPLYAILCELDYENETALKEFAAEWGILGTFLDDLQSARFLEPLPDCPDEPTVGRQFRVGRERESPASFHEVHWSPNGADATLHSVEFTDPSNLPEGTRREEWAEHFELLFDKAHQHLVPGSVAIKSFYGQSVEMPLPEYYRHFFPNGDLPAPDSPQLFESLSEPLALLGKAVWEMRLAYAYCVVAQVCPTEAINWFLERVFSHHLRFVTPVLKCEQGAKHQAAYRFPSLLSAIYLMLLRDFTTPHRFLRHCTKEGCGRPVITDRVDRVYCSIPCKNTATARNWRASRRAKAEAANGERK